MTLLQRQYELEQEMRGLTLKRHEDRIRKAQQEGDEASSVYGLALMRRVIVPVAEAYEAWRAEVSSGKAGPRHTAFKLLEGIDPKVAALITAKVVIDEITGQASVNRTAAQIGKLIEDEFRFRDYEEKNGGLWEWLQKEYRDQRPTHKRYVLRNSHRNNIGWEEWSASQRLHVGQLLLRLFVESTGMAKIEDRQIGHKEKAKVVLATPETLEWIEQIKDRSALLLPVCLPMVAPPLDWSDPWHGGYYTNAVGRFTLVKTRNKNYLEELTNLKDEMEPVYRAVNALQRTPFKVNKKVLAVIDEVRERCLTIAKLPWMEDRKPRECPIDGIPREEWTPDQLAEFKRWKKEAKAIYRTNEEMMSKRLQVARTVSIAHQFKDEEAIYFPQSLCFRGRMYPLPMFLQPQGADLAKGLLLLARGKPINDGVAAGHLAIHGAGVYGFDKASLEDRIDWVEERNDLILATAADPLADLWWCDADKPWQFLAFCFEWAGFLTEGYGYVSHMAVAMDG